MDIKQIDIKLTELESEKELYQDALEVIEKQARVLREAKRGLIANRYGLAAGDKLVVTDECWANRGSHDLDGWSVGDLLTFDSVSLHDDTCFLTSVKGWGSSGAFPIAMVQKMRAAYLNSISEEVE